MKRIIGLLFFIQACLYADASYWNDEQVRSYAHHSELQRRWAWPFLAPYLRNVPSDFKILDIGCGDAAHVYWSPNLEILAFVFLASLLYGTVYLISKRIESSILCHFLLNFIHMTFFSYHRM